ncbi:MAG: hypothetical protein ACTSQP_14740 [Promethearchaeota archaeon]
MPKFKKETVRKKKKKKISEDEFAFRSVLLTAILSGIFLTLSLFLNGTEYFFDGILIKIINKTITYEAATDTTINVNDWVDNIIKGTVILLFFFFSYVSIANYKELTGKPATLKEGILLFLISLVQTIRVFWVFLYTLIGLILIIVYFYYIQEV